jgi:hypothetical protein
VIRRPIKIKISVEEPRIIERIIHYYKSISDSKLSIKSDVSGSLIMKIKIYSASSTLAASDG